MTATRLLAASFGLALLVGATPAPGRASATWEISVDDRRGARQGVVEQYASHDRRVGITVLCDERTPDFIVLLDFPKHLRVEGKSRPRWSDILVLTDRPSPLRPDAVRTRIRVMGQRDSARRMLRSDGAAHLVKTLRATDHVALVATPAIHGAEPPRIALDSRSFDASLRAACPWLSEQVATGGIGAGP